MNELTDYHEWIAAVRLISSKKENLPSRETAARTNPANTKSYYVSDAHHSAPFMAAQTAPVARQAPAPGPRVDDDGDVIMQIARLAAAIQPRAASGRFRPGTERQKPRAPWRSDAEARRIIDRGLCLRCEGAGHVGRDCPRFRPAIRPSMVATAAPAEEDDRPAEN